MAEPLDFSGKSVLVVGGTSGLGNGMAHGFRARGAAVHVTGTRPSAENAQRAAGAALFLASPLADYVVGQTIRVDGGMTLA